MSTFAAEPPRSGPGIGGQTILVVDDDDSMREAIARLLRAAGFEPAAHPSAEELLSATDTGAACVISDLRLPGMSGLDLLAALRARPTSAPFVLITAHDAPGLREEALQRGAAAYLTKPFRGTVLLETVRAVIASVPGETGALSSFPIADTPK